jgi:hypothetical protein
LVNQQLALGVAIGVGCALLVPVVGLAVAAGGARPMGRALARTGSVLGEKTRETLAELCEVYEDFAAEARSEAGHAGGGRVAASADDATEAPQGASA